MTTYQLQEWYPFFWALLGVLAWFVTALIEIYHSAKCNRAKKKGFKLKEKLFWAMTQTPKRLKRGGFA